MLSVEIKTHVQSLGYHLDSNYEVIIAVNDSEKVSVWRNYSVFCIAVLLKRCRFRQDYNENRQVFIFFSLKTYSKSRRLHCILSPIADRIFTR